MTAILRLVAVLWKPIAAMLAGLFLYGKGRADAKAKAELRNAKGFQSTIERISHAPVHSDAAVARERLRARDPDQR